MNEKIKLIYAMASPLTERWLSNFCLDELSGKFDLEYWDCSAFTRPSFGTHKVLSRPWVVVFKNISELAARLATLPPDALRVFDIKRNFSNIAIHREFLKHSDLLIEIDCFGTRATIDSARKRPPLIRRIFSKEQVAKLCERPTRTLAHAFYAGKYIKYRLDSRSDHVSRKRFSRINHPDYERYRKCLTETTPFAGMRYAVYIDNNFPRHTEIKLREPYLDTEAMAPKFYASLNRFFDRIEKKYDCEVKIAGHPIANYGSNPFGGREIVYDKTVELVKDSLGVLIHTSNAFSYVVLFDKPVALIYNAVYKTARIEYGRLQGEAELLKLPLTNTDDDVPADGEVFSKLDAGIAADYKAKYLIASPNETNAELYAKYFREIYAAERVRRGV